MFGIVFATFGAPAISGLVSSKGYEMNVVFGIGAVFAVIALVMPDSTWTESCERACRKI